MPVTPEIMRRINYQLILNQIQAFGPISRVEIAKKVSISATTVSSIVDDLIREELIIEEGQASSKGGRKALLLKLNPEARFLLGFDFSGDDLIGVLANLQGKVIAQEKEQLALPITQQEILKKIEAFYIKLTQQIDCTKLLGVGVSVPGVVDHRTGCVIYSTKLQWEEEFLLGPSLERVFHTTVHVDKNVNNAALAELWWGKAKEINNLMYLSFGNGIGSCLILDGEIYRGEHGAAGEIGHVPLDWNGPFCRCGNRGCFELMASRRTLIAMVRDKLAAEGVSGDENFQNPMQPKVSEIFNAYRYQNPIACEAINQIAINIGLGLIQTISLFNPGMIIIGGKLIEEGGPEFLKVILSYTHEQTANMPLIRSLLKKTPIVGTSLGEKSSVIGSYVPILNSFYKTPSL